MSVWSIDTPLRALEVAMTNCFLFDRHMVRHGRPGIPGQVISDMRGEPRRLLGELRSEHMLSLRDDAVRPWINPREDSAKELWRQWRGQMEEQKTEAFHGRGSCRQGS